MTLTEPLRAPELDQEIEKRIRHGTRDTKGTIFRLVLLFSLILSLAIIVFLLETLVQEGWDVYTSGLWDFLTGELRSLPDDPLIGISQGLRGSFWIAIMVIVLAFPIGIGAAIYLEEYAPHNRLTNFLELNIRNLAGVPSVVYGILGLTIFVQAMDWMTNGPTLMSAGITLAVLVLPIVIITSAEAIRSVPTELREAGYGVGATQWEVIRSHVLPYAAPGILTGTLLSLARAVGEAAPLILVGAITGRLATGSDSFFDISQLTERFTAMPIVITRWSTLPDPAFEPLTAAASLVLIVFVFVLNAAAIFLRNHFERKREGR